MKARIIGMLLVIAVTCGACSSSSSTTTSTSGATTVTTVAKDTGSHATGNITYEIVAGQVTFDSATKEYSVPVLVGNTGSSAAVPWCTAIVASSPGSDMGIAAPEKFSSLGAGANATVTVMVKVTVAGTATQVQTLCASSRSAASNSTNWNDAKITGPATTTTSPAANLSVAQVCTAARNLSEDVNVWQATGKEPSRTLSDTKTLATLALKPGANAQLAAEANAVGNSFKTGKLASVHAALEKMDSTCLLLEQ